MTAPERNRARDRVRTPDNPVDPNWGFAWPHNRHILYNRASADPEGKPWSERKKYIYWDEGEKKWAGPDEPESVAKLREGLEGVERNFIAILERNGIKRTDPTGQPYDANLHQAMAEEPSTEHAPGTVVQAWTQAWTLNGRLLKPAMVVVAKRADQEAVA